MDVYYQPRLASTRSIHRYKQTNNMATEIIRRGEKRKHHIREMTNGLTNNEQQ